MREGFQVPSESESDSEPEEFVPLSAGSVVESTDLAIKSVENSRNVIIIDDESDYDGQTNSLVIELDEDQNSIEREPEVDGNSPAIITQSTTYSPVLDAQCAVDDAAIGMAPDQTVLEVEAEYADDQPQIELQLDQSANIIITHLVSNSPVIEATYTNYNVGIEAQSEQSEIEVDAECEELQPEIDAQSIQSADILVENEVPSSLETDKEGTPRTQIPQTISSKYSPISNQYAGYYPDYLDPTASIHTYAYTDIRPAQVFGYPDDVSQHPSALYTDGPFTTPQSMVKSAEIQSTLGQTSMDIVDNAAAGPVKLDVAFTELPATKEVDYQREGRVNLKRKRSVTEWERPARKQKRVQRRTFAAGYITGAITTIVGIAAWLINTMPMSVQNEALQEFERHA